MNLQELKDLIEQLEEEKAGDDNFDLSKIDVRVAMQPSWPFEYSIVMPDRLEVFVLPEASEWPTTHEHVVYLAERNQLGYLPGVVKDEVWRF